MGMWLLFSRTALPSSSVLNSKGSRCTLSSDIATTLSGGTTPRTDATLANSEEEGGGLVGAGEEGGGTVGAGEEDRGMVWAGEEDGGTVGAGEKDGSEDDG